MHGINDKPAKFHTKTVTANWKETERTRNCSLYGSGRPEFHDTRRSLMRDDPELVYADPNTPILLQLLKERDARRQKEIEQLKKPSTSVLRNSRPSTAGSARGPTLDFQPEDLQRPSTSVTTSTHSEVTSASEERERERRLFYFIFNCINLHLHLHR
jgi:hypothetical protein